MSHDRRGGGTVLDQTDQASRLRISLTRRQPTIRRGVCRASDAAETKMTSGYQTLPCVFHDDSMRIGRKPAVNIQTRLLLTFNEGQDAEIHGASENAGSYFENTKGSGGASDQNQTIGWRPP